MAQLNDIAFYQGESVALRFTMTPVTNISGWTIKMTVRSNANDADPPVLQQTATLTTPASGVFTISLDHADTVTLIGNSTYAYDVQRVDSGSESVLSIGTLTILEEVLYS